MLWQELSRAPREWLAEFPTRYGYRLDFYCPQARLAIEVDGASHWGPAKAERDAWRDLVHERMGITTKRFSAREVETEVAWVAGEIEALVTTRLDDRAAAARDTALTVVGGAGAPDGVLDLDDDERLLRFPPDQPGWSEGLPACVTVLPVLPERGLVRSLLARPRW